MKNKDNVLHQLDKMDNLANQLNFIVKQEQPLEIYLEGINKLKEIIEQTRLFVESELTMYN
jgi:flagellar biosynthesis/type III secretory pathway chaperone